MEDRSVKELRRILAELDVKGRSSLNTKAKMLDAIESARTLTSPATSAVRLTERVGEFEKDYESKIDDILRFRDLKSGTHPIDRVAAERWIAAQTSERRRRAARTFIEHTHYITFNEVFECMRTAIIEVYANFEHEERVHIFVGSEKDSSQYFMSMVAFYLIKRLSYRVPAILYGGEAMPEGATVVVFDDCVYSGGQSGKLAHSFDTLSIRKLYFCTAVITRYALANGEHLANEMSEIGVKYIAGRVVPNLFDALGGTKTVIPSEYLDVRYYFSPYTEGMTPPSIIYFDHKIADANSTFLNVLLLGPVLPGELNYDEDTAYNLYIAPIAHHYRWSYVDANQKRLKQAASVYSTKLMKDEKGLKESLVSAPFIMGCTRPVDVSGVPYHVLQYEFNRSFYSREVQGYEDRLDRITSKANRCPQSFYKTLFRA